MTPCKCLKCGYEWQSRSETPGHCPQCKSIFWDKPNGMPHTNIAGRRDKKGHVR